MHGVDFDSEDLCLIDAGIQSLADIPLKPHLKVLNVHCNHIRRLEHLSQLQHLVHLDLSSNQIHHIQGLDGLVSLRTLNLSCNFIQLVKGLRNLRSLVKLNLSYNQIIDISGFQDCHGNQYKLSQIDLHGNKLQSVDHVTRSLSGCHNLRELTLEHDDQDNPVCHLSGYREKMLGGLTQVQVLDSIDRSEQLVGHSEIMADIPGLDQYLDYLLSSSTASTEINPIELATPAIDEALDRFRRRAVSSPNNSTPTTSDVQHITTTTSSIENQTKLKRKSTDHEDRLEKLENQLAELLCPQKQNSVSDSSKTQPNRTGLSLEKEIPERKPVKKLTAKRDVDNTDESESGGRVTYPRPRPQRKTKIPTRKGQTKDREKKFLMKEDSFSNDVQRDEKRREELHATYVQLMRELEGERERRWKAEQAARKLVEHVQKLQNKGKEGQELQDIALEATTRLKQALTNEREAKLRLQSDLDACQERAKELEAKVASCDEQFREQTQALRAMQETATRVETERLQQHAYEAKKFQECQIREAGIKRECDLLKNTVKTLKGQLQQVQELLVSREQEHRAAMEGLYGLNSPELQNLLHRETNKIEEKFRQEGQNSNLRMVELKKAYTDLEDEFRLALTIESKRFAELQSAYEELSKDNAENKHALMAVQSKDDKSSKIINELTSLVKEQKGRITELSKSKQEQVVEMKERILTLEAHLEEARKRMVQMELLKQERSKLQSQVQAQESVIDGLRQERKLWGHELAQQGASLAQDRGRLEAKVDALTAEVSSVQKELQRTEDALKIKSKMLEDQTDSIKRLKDGLQERDSEIKSLREETVKIQKDLENQLAAETALNQDLQEKVERLTDRKEELKQQVADLELDLENSKKAHSILNTKWKDKSELIGRLEQQVRQVKESWEGKEKKLTSERDEALKARDALVEKLKVMDDAFRKQLDQKETGHQAELHRKLQQKGQEIESANMKVLAAEDEMRLILKENQDNKRAMEERLKKVTRAFSELQSDLM